MADSDTPRKRGRLAEVPGGEIVALSALYESTRAIGIRSSLDDLLQEVLNQAERLIGFEHAALMLYDEQSETLHVARLRGYGDRRAELGATRPVGRLDAAGRRALLSRAEGALRLADGVLR